MSNVEEQEYKVDIWMCPRCGKEFIEPEAIPKRYVPKVDVEPRLYWIGFDSICSHCAMIAGVPAIDKE